ncbi:MAG: hypothetical protein JSS66_03335 [Armatimonadetes bacterium]|nr:hypothetical protein [Armatimonadota bacterium]
MRITTATNSLHFQDKRAPWEIQVVLEKHLMTLFSPSVEEERLVLRAHGKVTGAEHDYMLRLDEVGLIQKHYTFVVKVDWSRFEAMHDDYFQRTADSWFEYWTKDFMRCSPPDLAKPPGVLYGKVVEETLAFESEFKTSQDVQSEIVRRMKAGAQFRTAHKEGGTVMRWTGKRFESSDYGDYPDERKFAREQEFLDYVRKFFDMETARSTYPEKPNDLDTWKLILRLLWN